MYTHVNGTKMQQGACSAAARGTPRILPPFCPLYSRYLTSGTPRTRSHQTQSLLEQQQSLAAVICHEEFRVVETAQRTLQIFHRLIPLLLPFSSILHSRLLHLDVPGSLQALRHLQSPSHPPPPLREKLPDKFQQLMPALAIFDTPRAERTHDLCAQQEPRSGTAGEEEELRLLSGPSLPADEAREFLMGADVWRGITETNVGGGHGGVRQGRVEGPEDVGENYLPLLQVPDLGEPRRRQHRISGLVAETANLDGLGACTLLITVACRYHNTMLSNNWLDRGRPNLRV
jgi:hypothetical protein